MSKEALVEFAATIRADETMEREFGDALGSHQGAEAEAAVIAFAQSRGFEVTDEDMAEVRQATMQAASAGRDLSDAELEAVAGGFFLSALPGLANVIKQVVPIVGQGAKDIATSVGGALIGQKTKG